MKTQQPYSTLCIVIIAAAFTVSAVGCGKYAQTPQIEPRSESRPNIILVVCDALRADRVGALRNNVPLMPNLQNFADSSWNYTNTRVQATWTKPSMATIFTSLYPETHQVLYGIHDTIYEGQPPRADVLPDSLETMASFLRTNEYATAGIQTNANINAAFGFDQGFDSYTFHKYPEYRATQVTNEAIATLETLRPPFFLYAHYMDPHAPYDPPVSFRKKIGPEPELTETDRDLMKDYGASYIDRILYEIGLTNERAFGNLSKAGEAYIEYCYDGETLYLDSELARLMSYVKENLPNTIVVITADHGEELWDHGSIGHAKTVYEELTRVPLIIQVPGEPPRVIDAPVETVDILPTIAALLGMEPRTGWQGRNISNPESLDTERPIYSSTQASIPGSNVDLAAVVRSNNKLILHRESSSADYFDLAADPEEANPLGTITSADALNQLWSSHMNAQRPVDRATTEVDSETVEAIKAIGYGR